MSNLLNIDIAHQTLLAAVNPVSATEIIPLLEAYDRVLAQEYYAAMDVPPAANSAMDGYAVRSDDTISGCSLAISQRIAAGDEAQPLIPGTAARIFTGAEIPAGANAVVIQEDCIQEDDHIRINCRVNAGDNIRPQGQDIASGTLLFSPGHLIRAQDVALLASVNIHQVIVYRKLRVAFLSTGNELIEPGNQLLPGKIYNSNRYLIAGFIKNLHCEFIDIGIVKDNFSDTVNALKKAANSDLIISSGGVSVGDEDYIKSAVKTLGEIYLWKLNIKPGKPLAFGRVENTPFIGLPGNPVSAFVTFELLVKDFIYKLQGRKPEPQRIEYHTAQFDIPIARKRCEFLRGYVDHHGVNIYPQQSSGALSSVTWANCLVRIDEGKTVTHGDKVKIYRLD